MIDVQAIDPAKLALLPPEDAAKLRALSELTAVIVRLKDGLDHEVNALVAIPVEITTEADMLALTERVREARNTKDNVSDRHAALRTFSNQLHKAVCGQENELQTKVDGWIAGAGRSIAAFDRAENARRAAEQTELQKTLDKEHEKIVEKGAKKLEKAGDQVAAANLRQQGQYQRPVAYVPPVAAPAKTTIKQAYGYVVDDPGAVPRIWCQPDEKKIKDHVKNFGKDAIGQIPGVRVFALDPSAVVRR